MSHTVTIPVHLRDEALTANASAEQAGADT